MHTFTMMKFKTTINERTEPHDHERRRLDKTERKLTNNRFE